MKLAISIVTANRPQHIEEDLEVITQATEEYGIGVYIFDGSDNCETERVVNAFIDKGHRHIQYSYYGKENVDERFADAIMKPQAAYIWLCGDKFLVLPENYSLILKLIAENYDIITIYDGGYTETKSFISAEEYIKYCFVPLTHIGSTVIRKNLLDKVDIRQCQREAPGFFHVFMYMQAIDLKEIKGIALYKETSELKYNSKYKTKSNSLSYMWSTWIERWYHMIMNCPERYAGIRKSLLNLPDKQMRFFSFKELLRQRSENQFDLKKCMADKQYITDVIVLPNGIIYGIALLPKCIARVLHLVVAFITFGINGLHYLVRKVKRK